MSTELVALVRKEFIQALRDRRMLFMILGVPIVQILIFGFAANLEFQHAATAVVDDDGSAESRELVRGLGAEGTFAITELPPGGDVLGELRLGRAQAGLVIPRGFSERVRAGRPTQLQLLVDGTEPTRAVAASAALQAWVARRSLGASEATVTASGAPLPAVPRVLLEPRLLYNPAMKSRLFMVPGTAASILLIVTTIVTAMGLAREREIGTMEQLLVTPIRPLTLMLGKTIPYALFGLVDEALILIVGNVVFDVPLGGSMAVVFLGTLLYLVATLSVGLLISTVARTQQQALMGGFFFLLPALLLSGFLTPVEAMPDWIRPITWLSPIRFFIEVVRGSLLRGATFTDLLPHLGMLALLGASFLLLATVRFRRQIA